MDVQLRGNIKSTKVALVVPKEGDAYLEGTVTLVFEADASGELADLAEIQLAGEAIIKITSVQLSMPGVREAARRLRDAAGPGATVSAGGRTVDLDTGELVRG